MCGGGGGGILCLLLHCEQPRWPSGKASASGAADLGSSPAFPVGFFPGGVIPVTFKLGAPVAPLPGARRY